MLSLVAERTLGELGVIRAVLSGEMDKSALPPMPGASCEADHRNRIALGMITRLGIMVSRVLEVSAESEGIVYALAGGRPPIPVRLHEEVEEEEKVFGFAAGRKAA